MEDVDTFLLSDNELCGPSLEECFKNILEGSTLELDLNNLKNILKRDLQVNFYYLKPKIKSLLPLMLGHFIRSWPGWQRSSNYFNKQISFENWYAKFKEHLMFKVNYLIKSDFDRASAMLKSNSLIDESVLFKIDNSTQTTSAEKPLAPYCIAIHGSPKTINSLVFSEGVNDNIIIKEYGANPINDRLTARQLINWPHIEVEFNSKELQFWRKNMHEYKRYLMFSSEKIIGKKEALIEEIDIINEELSRRAYTLNIIKEYCRLYITVIKKHQTILLLTEEGIAEIETILEEFLLDIQEINLNSIATNTSVLFNIANCNYARNKCVRTSNQAVCFAESITPRIKLSLFEFNAVMEENKDTSFQLLQEISTTANIPLIRSICPKIQYNCTFCKRYFMTKSDILNHLKQKHCMEQPILCFKCKSQLNVTTLTENRWQHMCTKDDGESGSG